MSEELKFRRFYTPRIGELYHNGLCDVDPETLTWKRDIQKGETATICFECHEKIMDKRFSKGEKVRP